MRNASAKSGIGYRTLRFAAIAAAVVLSSPFAALEAGAERTRACKLVGTQSVNAMHGKFTNHAIEDVDPITPLTMNILTGTVLVVDGQGTQMSMLHNFGRGFSGDVIGLAALDCGSASEVPIAKSWICRGIVADEESNGVSEAREIRLKRVKARKNPQCRTVKLDPS